VKPLRVGIIGAGVMGRHYAKALREYERAEVIAVCDLNLAAALTLAGDGAEASDSVEAMLRGACPDAAVVATPDFAHREPAVACLEAGLAVLCEKPLATTAADCAALVEAVERTGRPFMVNFGNRHRPSALKLREALQEGRVGAPQYVYARLNERLAKTLTIPWLARTSPVWFLMSHCADLVCWLLDDEFAEVTARAAHGVVAQHAAGVPDLCVCLATLKSGCQVVLETAWNLPEGFAPNIDFLVQAIGDAGVIQADLVPHDLNVYDSRAGSVDYSFDVIGPRGYGAGWWQESVRYFVDGVLDQRPLRPTVHEAAQVTRALLAVEEAVHTGGIAECELS
jgi:predicted dehydrogenase